MDTNEILAKLAELNRKKGDVCRKLTVIEQKYGTDQVDELRVKLNKLDTVHSTAEALWEENDDLTNEMSELIEELPEGVSCEEVTTNL